MTVVVGYLPSPEGLAALDRAVDEVSRTGDKLVVVNTGQNGNYATPAFAPPQDLDAIRAQLTDKGIEHEVLQPTNGLSAADEILIAAGTHHATMVVIGIRRRSPVGKLFTGSTAQQVLLDADCPVLAVKAPAAR